MLKIFVAACALASGCATIVNDAAVHNIRINIWHDGFAKAEFEQPEPFVMRELGACKLTELSRIEPHEFREHAGVLHFAARGAPIALSPDRHGEYRISERRGEAFWNDGDSIAITADGANVPAFRVTLPAPLEIVPVDPPREDPTYHPDVNPCPECTIRPPKLWALRDIPVRWVPRAGTTFTVELIHGYKRVRCDFDGALGQATVPQALIAELPGGTEVELRATSSREPTFYLRGWSIHVMAWRFSSKQYLMVDPRELNEPGDDPRLHDPRAH